MTAPSPGVLADESAEIEALLAQVERASSARVPSTCCWQGRGT